MKLFNMSYIPRLKTEYKDRITTRLTEEFGYSNIMQVPKLEKIVLSRGDKLDAILNNFSIFYGKRYNVGLQLSLESNEMHRKNIVKKVLTWFKNNFCK